jgi:hypothetical protein
MKMSFLHGFWVPLFGALGCWGRWWLDGSVLRSLFGALGLRDRTLRSVLWMMVFSGVAQAICRKRNCLGTPGESTLVDSFGLGHCDLGWIGLVGSGPASGSARFSDVGCSGGNRQTDFPVLSYHLGQKTCMNSSLQACNHSASLARQKCIAKV